VSAPSPERFILTILMPKIITAKRLDNETELAREYVKTHILFPSGLLGLVFMLAGTASLIYQFMVESYGWPTFAQSTGLLVAGGLLGWAQTRYHRYLLREHPAHFADRLRVFTRAAQKRARREPSPGQPAHRGQSLVPLYYALGVAGLLGASAAVATRGQVYYMAAFLLPWAGFFWAKMFFWRGILLPVKK
jgi:hypothetical protein